LGSKSGGRLLKKLCAVTKNVEEEDLESITIGELFLDLACENQMLSHQPSHLRSLEQLDTEHLVELGCPLPSTNPSQNN
jgi:hypothetical protein